SGFRRRQSRSHTLPLSSATPHGLRLHDPIRLCLKRSKTNSNRREAGTRTVSEKTELEIPNSSSPESLPFFLRSSWTCSRLIPGSGIYAPSVLAVPSKQSCQTTAKISGVPPRRIKATPFQLADI